MIIIESIDSFNINIINKKTNNIYKVDFNLNTEKLIAKIKSIVKKYDKNDLSFEITYNKNGKETVEEFDSMFKLIYRIKTI